METRKEREARQKRRERAAATPKPEAKRPSEEEASIEAGTRRTPGRTCARGARRESGRAAALSLESLSRAIGSARFGGGAGWARWLAPQDTRCATVEPWHREYRKLQDLQIHLLPASLSAILEDACTSHDDAVRLAHPWVAG